MDYTLIQYHVAEWEQRAYEYALEKLKKSGWPIDGCTFDRQHDSVAHSRSRPGKPRRQTAWLCESATGTRPLPSGTTRQDYARTIVDHREPASNS